MGIHINNVNTPVHIGSRGMRRGSSSRQLRGIKKTNSVSSLNVPSSLASVESSPVVKKSSPVVESSTNCCRTKSSIPDDGIGKIFESEVKKL